MPRAEKLSILETERMLQEKRTLIEAAAHYMRMLSQAAGTDRHAAMLGDSRAVVLDVVGDEQTLYGPDSVPGPGSLLSEAMAGANGIGTPLEELAYAELQGPEHFIEGFHPFTCQGIPMKDADGAVIGVLSVSVRGADVASRLKEILECAAYGIQAELMNLRLEEDVRRVLAAEDENGALLEVLRQDILQSHTASRLRIERAARSIAGRVSESATQGLELARRSIQRFARRAQLFRELASPDVEGRVAPLELSSLACDVADLLDTEAAIKGVLLQVHADEPVWVQAATGKTARELMSMMSRAIESAGPKGLVEVRVVPALRGGGELLVQFFPAPGAGSPGLLRSSFAVPAVRLVGE